MLSKTIKEELQQKIEDKREERQWVINAIRSNEKEVRKYMKMAKKCGDKVDKYKKLVDKNDKQIKQLQEILSKLDEPTKKSIKKPLKRRNNNG